MISGSSASARDRNALLLAARQVHGISRCLVLQADPIEQPPGPLVRFLGLTLENNTLREADVVDHAEMRVEFEVLEHHPDPLPQTRGRSRFASDIDTVHENMAVLVGL
jgi:hypothetical protein